MDLIIVAINNTYILNQKKINNMKKIISIGVFLMVLSVGSFAQKAADMFTNLNLTEQQKTSVDSVRKTFNKTRKQINSDTTLTAEQKTAKLKDMRKEQTQKIASFLTAEQRQKLKEETKAKAKKEGQ